MFSAVEWIARKTNLDSSDKENVHCFFLPLEHVQFSTAKLSVGIFPSSFHTILSKPLNFCLKGIKKVNNQYFSCLKKKKDYYYHTFYGIFGMVLWAAMDQAVERVVN